MVRGTFERFLLSNNQLLFQHILSEPEEMMAVNGHKLPVRLQVAYISFSAHTDYRQTSEFIRIVKPSHVVGYVRV